MTSGAENGSTGRAAGANDQPASGGPRPETQSPARAGRDFDSAEPDQPSAHMNAVRADRRLIDRCLSGEPTAWDQLYEHYHPLLLVAAGLWLGRHASDTDLVEEIAARVWYALVKDHGRLLDRFDTARGCRLVTFIARIAKSEIRQYFRSERRRRAREKVASQYEIDLRGLSVGQLETLLEEFADSLTPREKQFLRSNLLGRQVDGRQESISHANQWQLKHRIRRKLRSFTRFG